MALALLAVASHAGEGRNTSSSKNACVAGCWQAGVFVYATGPQAPQKISVHQHRDKRSGYQLHFLLKLGFDKFAVYITTF